ncbi:hypothetical protein BGX23_005379 [Mortierella sp. AD031]|nr:hypothetical protein BGX23_005379 [Mortierella sp. AD031]
MASVSSRLDGLSEVTELERIPLPYKELYHTLVFKNDMPVDLLQEKHRTGAQQLLTWIKAALDLVQSVHAASLQEQQQQQQQQREADEIYKYDGHSSRTSSSTSLLENDLDVEIQDVVSGFGQYEPIIESSIEILLQLEECIPRRLLSSSTSSIASDTANNNNHNTQGDLDPTRSHVHLSSDLDSILEQWSLLRGIISDLGGSVREHQRLRDGIQSINNISEQTRQASDILDKCFRDIAAEKARVNELASSPSSASIDRVVSSLRNHSSSSVNGGPQSWGVDRNDMLELDSRIGLLSLKMESLHKSYPECARFSKQSRGASKARSTTAESESIADKKAMMQRNYQELLSDWFALRTRRDQLWRGLEECDRWRTRIEKMAKQIETMLEPVEIFQKMCDNMLANLEGQTLAQDEQQQHQQQQQDADMASTSKQSSLSVDLELLTATLQELDEKQTTVAPAIENIFWVQEGEIHHRAKNNGAHSPMTPTTAVSTTAPPLSAIDSPTTTLVTPPSPPSNNSNSNNSDSSPLYPSLEMLDRQRELKHRWSILKTSLDTVGVKLQIHHAILKEKAEASLAKKKEEAIIAEDKTLVGSGSSIYGSDWRSTRDPNSPPAFRRSATASSSRSPSVARSSASVTRPISPNWNPSSRFLRGKLVSSLSMDSGVVRKYMLVKSDAPSWTKPRPWCPSVSTSSPSMPGFPLPSSYWGYFLVGNDPDKDNFGKIIAAPAPPLVRSPTPSPVQTPPTPKDTRPPFSPGGNRKFTALSTPPRPMPNRSMSVAAGEFKRSMSPAPAGGTDILDWTKTLRRSTSFTNTKTNNNGKGSKGNTPQTPQGNSMIKSSGSTTSSNNTTRPSGGNGRASVAPSTRRNSNASQISQWNDKGQGQYRQTRRPSFTSSEDDETIMGYTAGVNGQAPLGNNNDRRARRQQGHTKSGGHGHGLPPPPLNTMSDSTSSLDSMLSSSTSSYNAYGSSFSSSIGMRSPSPYAPMFGSSFAAARSTAALHTALLASMSSSSSASLRYSSSSLGGAAPGGKQQQSDAGSSSSSLMKKKKSQVMNLGGGGVGSASSASSWMSMNTGGLLSALSFTVPTYSFDDDFAALGNLEESIAAM